ncbi:MAG: prepilin peptidase [Butyrivibrio sp.]|nr:prepilin peptidase [Butyrivibrio sp.]
MTGAVFTDLLRDKIYNAYCIPGLVIGTGAALLQGAGSFFTSLSAVALSLVILIPVYLVKGIAAGDVKLIASAASFLSLQETLSCILVSFIIAGVISIAILFISRTKQRTIHFALPVLASVLFVVGGVL